IGTTHGGSLSNNIYDAFDAFNDYTISFGIAYDLQGNSILKPVSCVFTIKNIHNTDGLLHDYTIECADLRNTPGISNVTPPYAVGSGNNWGGAGFGLATDITIPLSLVNSGYVIKQDGNSYSGKSIYELLWDEYQNPLADIQIECI